MIYDNRHVKYQYIINYSNTLLFGEDPERVRYMYKHCTIQYGNQVLANVMFVNTVQES